MRGARARRIVHARGGKKNRGGGESILSQGSVQREIGNSRGKRVGGRVTDELSVDQGGGLGVKAVEEGVWPSRGFGTF